MSSTIKTGKNNNVKVSGDETQGFIAHNLINKDDLTVVGDTNPLPVNLKNLLETPYLSSIPDIDGIKKFLNCISFLTMASFSEGSSSRSGAWAPTCELLLDGNHRVPLNTMPVSCDGQQSNVGSGKSLAFSQVTVGTSAIVVSNDGTSSTGKRGVTIRNNGSQSVYVGDVGVTTSNGYLLKQDEHIDIHTMNAVYCRCAASTTTVSVIEF